MSPPRTVKVAVVGSGLAGLTAAYLLSQPTRDDVQFEVHLFEKAATIGMDSSSVSIPFPGSKNEWRLDVPMRSFQGGYYPQLIAMYKQLGVEFRQADFSYSFSVLMPSTMGNKRSITTTAIYNGASGRAGVSKPAILATPPRNKQQNLFSHLVYSAWGTGVFAILTIQIALCFLLTLRHALPFWRIKFIETMVFGDWVKEVAPRSRLARWVGLDVAWQDYVQTILLPMMSAMCTAPEEDVINHPVEEILDYIWLTLGTHHYVVTKGVQEVVSRLTSNLSHIHLSLSIEVIKPDPLDSQMISVQCVGINGPQQYDGFHHIILATQASNALPLLASYANFLSRGADIHKGAIEAQMRCLRSFKYRSTVVVNHIDNTLLPDDLRDRRDLNLISTEWEDEFPDNELCVSSSFTMATQVLSRPKGYPADLPDIYQTTNPFIPPRKDTILSIASLERAILTSEGKEAVKGLCQQERRRWWECPTQAKCGLGTLQGAGRLNEEGIPGVWICGSFAYIGVPLLEGCVISARNIVEKGILKSEGLRLKHAPWCT